MPTTRTKKKQNKRPNLKTIQLSDEALAIWNTTSKQHNWSEEISKFIVGMYAKQGVTPDQKLLYLKILKKGYVEEHRRQATRLGQSMKAVIDQLQEEIEQQQEKIKRL